MAISLQCIDRSQAVVISGLLAVLSLFLWLVTLFGYWQWSPGNNVFLGITLFCASYCFSPVINCHMVVDGPLNCPVGWISPTCVYWGDTPIGNDADLIVLQVLTVSGAVVGLASAGVAILLWVSAMDSKAAQRGIVAGLVLSALNATLSLGSVAAFVSWRYPLSIREGGEGCLYVVNVTSNAITCVGTKTFELPMESAYAFSSCVFVFILSVCCVFLYASAYSRIRTMKKLSNRKTT